jgi:Transcriptional Coactivator p15 (PC4)
MQQITNAISAEDTSLDVELSSMRKVGILKFKADHMVNIREYYEKDGALAPGSKGIALKAAQWAALTAVMGELHTRVHKAA